MSLGKDVSWVAQLGRGCIAARQLGGHFRIKLFGVSGELSLGPQPMAPFQGGGDIVYGAEGQDGVGGPEVHPTWGREMPPLRAVTQVPSCWDLPSW